MKDKAKKTAKFIWDGTTVIIIAYVLGYVFTSGAVSALQDGGYAVAIGYEEAKQDE